MDSAKPSFTRNVSEPTTLHTDSQMHCDPDSSESGGMTTSVSSIRDLRSLMVCDKSLVHVNEQLQADAASEFLSDQHSEKKDTQTLPMNVKVRDTVVAIPGSAEDVNLPDATRDSSEVMDSSHENQRQTSVWLQRSKQASHAVDQRDQETVQHAGEQFQQNQVAKLQKGKRLLRRVFLRKFKTHRESKGEEGSYTTGRKSSSSKKHEAKENDQSVSKSAPELASSNGMASTKGLFYGASLGKLVHDLDVSSSIGQSKAVDTMSPDDLQSDGSSRLNSSIAYSFDTAEEQFSGDDCSQVSEVVSVSSTWEMPIPFKRKCLYETEENKLTLESRTENLKNLTAEERDIVSSSFNSRETPHSGMHEIDPIHGEQGSPLQYFEYLCPSGGEEQVVLYTTSLRSIKKTYEECINVKMILQGFNVKFDERDISMHSGFRKELKNLLSESSHVPRLFIKGRYVGGAEEVTQFNEKGLLIKLLEKLPMLVSRELCEACGGVSSCSRCCGSCKIASEGKTIVHCPNCNENGLIRCPVCC